MAAAKEKEVYEPYKAVNRNQTRLMVRPVSQPWERITYGYLLRIVEDNGFGTSIALVYTFCVVVIKGKNLQAIAAAIDAETCEMIQQYDASKWQKPEPDKPVIESIHIHSETEGSDESGAGAKRGKKP